MAEVVVRVEDFEDGVVPPWCVATGEDGGRLRRADARYEPGWPLVFLVFGPVGFVVALFAISALTRRVDGFLPLTDAAVQRLDRSRRTALTLLGGTVVVTVCGMVALFSAEAWPAMWAVGTLGAAAIALAVWRVARPAGSVTAHLERNFRTVRLKGVHERFAVAYDAQELERRRARRDETARH
jgi:hypothetical protein